MTKAPPHALPDVLPAEQERRMITNRIRLSTVAVFLTISSLALADPVKPADKQPATTVTSSERTGQGHGSTTTTESAGETNSEGLRTELREVLESYPPEVGMALKLDPILFNNQQYLATYPALASFLAAHPEVAHNPRYYLESVSIRGDLPIESTSYRMFRGILNDLLGFSVFLVFVGILVWVIRTLIAQKRWARLSLVQTETHGKLLDRFTSNEDLLAYIQSPAGKRFLESAPIPLDAGPQPMGAPMGRVLWSVQAGLVLVTTGFGLRFVSGHAPADASQSLYAIGIVILAIGVGFILSAIVSLALSRWLGLWKPPSLSATGAAEADGQTNRF
jgi:hypothetical protein